MRFAVQVAHVALIVVDDTGRHVVPLVDSAQASTHISLEGLMRLVDCIEAFEPLLVSASTGELTDTELLE